MRTPLLAFIALLGCADSPDPTQNVEPKAAKLAFVTQPANGVAGVPLAPAVKVVLQDAQGITVPNATNTVTLTLGAPQPGDTLKGVATLDADNGFATFTELRMTRAGSGYTLVANSPGLPEATSTAFAITASAPFWLQFLVHPAAVTAGASFSPTVQVAIQDFYRNTVTSAAPASIVLAMSSNGYGAILSGSTTAQSVSGVASFPGISIDRPGAGYGLSATLTGVQRGFTNPFNVVLPFGDVVSGGGGHTCGLSAGGAAYCWGNNSVSQLGNAGAGNPQRGVRVPVPVSGGRTFTWLSVGFWHACGLTSTGVAYCWGYNNLGQLGNGSQTTAATPTLVPGGVTFEGVSAGQYHTCGLDPEGAALCWGADSGGQLGNGPAGDALTPQAVTGGLSFAVIAAGWDHTCGVSTSGAAYCWGSNSFGKLGDGTTTSSHVPVPVSGGLVFSTIGASRVHSCGLTTAGAAYCWGVNVYGELGNGTLDPSSVPVAVTGGLTFSSITVGQRHTCGLTAAGKAFCWGANSGQLGNGTTAFSTPAPSAVVGGHTFALVSAGSDHTCGLTTSKVAYCWGFNTGEQLGTASVGDFTTVPVRVVQ